MWQSHGRESHHSSGNLQVPDMQHNTVTQETMNMEPSLTDEGKSISLGLQSITQALLQLSSLTPNVEARESPKDTVGKYQ